MRTLLSSVVLLALLCGCGTGELRHNPQECVVCKIDSLAINHIQDKREGCKFTTLELYLGIINNCDSPVEVNQTIADPCDHPLRQSTVYLRADTGALFFVSATSDSIVTVPSKEKRTARQRSGFRVEGWSLESIETRYRLVIGQPVGVLLHGGILIPCTASNTYRVLYLLDDQRVMSQSDPRYRKSLPAPQLLNVDSIINSPANADL